MKKIKILLLVIVIAVVVLPLVGNKVIENVLEEKVSILTSNGIEIKKTSSDSSYFSTNKHYEFAVNDSKKFTTYLNQYNNKQLPSYVDMMLQGMVVGFDLTYSNVLFSDTVKLDIYPITLSDEMTKNLKKGDKDFYKFITDFVKIKGLLYHVNYDLGSEDFNGYIKDIDEEYISKDSSKIKLLLKNMNYSGNGSLIHPYIIDSSIEKILVISNTKNEKLNFNVENVKATSNFKTKTTYSTLASISILELDTQELQNSSHVLLSDAKFDLSTDTQGEKAKFNSKTFFKKLVLKTSASDLIIKGFNYDISLKDIDKNVFEELSRLLEEAQTDLSQDLQLKISNSMITLFSKGLHLDIKDVSIDKLSKDNSAEVDAFSFRASLDIDADDKLLKAPKATAFMKNIKLDALIKISKDFFKMMNQELPVSMLASGFAKEVKNDYVFDIKFQDSKLKVNGKVIR